MPDLDFDEGPASRRKQRPVEVRRGWPEKLRDALIVLYLTITLLGMFQRTVKEFFDRQAAQEELKRQEKEERDFDERQRRR